MRTSKAIVLTVCLGLVGSRTFALDPQFNTPVNYAVNLGPEQVVTADFNGDGKPDLASVNSLSNNVSVLMNNGNGTFAAPVTYAVGAHPVALCTVDVDADGFPDLAVANYSAASVSILMNLTDGTFDPAVDYSTGGIQPTSVCAADFDGDVKIDLAVANYGSGNVAVMINLNNSKYPTSLTYATGTNPTSVCAADINLDGKPDLVVTNSADNTVSILTNNGNGTFPTAVNYGTGSNPISVFAADLDGNGSPDLAVANYAASTISVLKNNGNGTFATAVDYATNNSPKFILAVDLDKDGKRDLSVANEFSDDISVLRNNGTGVFGTAVNHIVGIGPSSICAADFDLDGMTDLAVSNGSSNNLSVLISLRQHSITATAGANGSIAPSGVVGVYEGTDQTFTISPNVGYHVANVVVDGSSIGAPTSHTFTGITVNHTISASFAINQYTITATAGAHGSINPIGAVVKNYGTDQSFSITADVGYHVLDVVVDGISEGPLTGRTFTFVASDHTITASFAINTYTITASSGPNGTVTPGSVTTINYGGTQTYNITPNSCYHVADVLVDAVSVGAVTSYPFSNVSNNHTISASFALNVQTVTAAAGLHGSIAPNGAVPVNCGSDQGFVMTPNQWYHVADVLVDGVSVGAVTNYNIMNVTKDQPITVTFACCSGVTGNVNMTGIVDLSDLSSLVNYLTGGGYTLPCPNEANVNGIGIVDLSDLSALVSYLTGGGYVLPSCS